MKIEVNRRNQILSGLRLDYLYLALHAAPAVNNDLSVTRPPAQVFVIILLKSGFAYNVSGPQPACLIFLVFQLLWTYFAYVAKDVSKYRP
ncbi:hypothetical protein OFM36_29800, partial [Escherichia coli]|nr:hypothetical protein [Escherichia coli]